MLRWSAARRPSGYSAARGASRHMQATTGADVILGSRPGINPLREA